MSAFTDRLSARRWMLERALGNARRRAVSGVPVSSKAADLMALPRMPLSVNLNDIFGAEQYAIVGGVATRYYMPERATKDIDVLVSESALARVHACIHAVNGTKHGELAFEDFGIGLRGEQWNIPNLGSLDLLWSHQPWAKQALREAKSDPAGQRVIALAYLALMKMAASRVQDQADLARMLGLADDATIAHVKAVFVEHMPEALEDLASFVELGRLEIGSARERYHQERGDSSD